LGANGRAVVEGSFTDDHMARNMQAVFESATAGRRD